MVAAPAVLIGVGAYFLSSTGGAARAGAPGAGAGGTGSHSTGSGALPALAQSVRCSGCPPPPEGPGLLHDIALARAVLEGPGSVPPGWEQAGTAPPARQDVADGKADPTGARDFVRCMGLGAQTADDVMRNADQVLNMGGAPLVARSDASVAPEATMSRWVDMVASRQDASRDWGVYASARFSACAGYIFAPSHGRSAPRGTGGSPAVTRSAPPTSVARTILSLPEGARGVLLRPYISPGGGGFFMGLATVGRVQVSVVLDDTAGAPGAAGGPGGQVLVPASPESSEKLVRDVLTGMVERAVGAGSGPGI